MPAGDERNWELASYRSVETASAGSYKRGTFNAEIRSTSAKKIKSSEQRTQERVMSIHLAKDGKDNIIDGINSRKNKKNITKTVGPKNSLCCFC